MDIEVHSISIGKIFHIKNYMYINVIVQEIKWTQIKTILVLFSYCTKNKIYTMLKLLPELILGLLTCMLKINLYS